MNKKKTIFLGLAMLLVACSFSYMLGSREQKGNSTELEATEIQLAEGSELQVTELFMEYYGSPYTIYRVEETYILCENQKVLATTKLEDYVEPYNRDFDWPFAYSEGTHTLYIVQCNIAEPNIEFIKVATNCIDVSSMYYDYIAVPVYKDMDTGKYYGVLPKSQESYLDFAMLESTAEEQDAEYSSEYELVEIIEEKISLSFYWKNDRMSWEINGGHIDLLGKEYEIYIKDIDDGIQNNFLNYIIFKTDPEAAQKLDKYATYVAYKDVDAHIAEIQAFLNEWAEENPNKIVQFYLEHPEDLQSDCERNNGIKEWLVENPEYAEQLKEVFAEYCFGFDLE